MTSTNRICIIVALSSAALVARPTRAQEGEIAEPSAEPSNRAEAPAPFTIGGWVEAYYAYNFNDPSNGITDLRGFDNRHNTFNLSNIVLDAQWDWEDVNGQISLQWGSTPATYYLAETDAPSLGTGIGPQDQALWQWVQQAHVGYRIPIGRGLNVQAGLFLHPMGVENMAVKDNWLYSRSQLFYGFPFYHTGLRVSYEAIDGLTFHGWIVNGWNTVLDNNDEKSFVLQATLRNADWLSVNFSYSGGVERPRGASEGRAWRHTFDLNGTLDATTWLAFQAQAAGGFEHNNFGTSSYGAGMFAVRVSPLEWLSFAARGDFFWESVAQNDRGQASSIFWPVEWVSSATLGADIHPDRHVSLRLEYRHDHAAGDAYFAGRVEGDGSTIPFVHNTDSQDTVTAGATAWF